MSPTQNRSYATLLGYARRAAKRADEAEDLLQAVLLAAVEAGRADMTCVDNRRWLIGALRKRAVFEARSAVRRRQREANVPVVEDVKADSDIAVAQFVRALPRSLKTTALLALTGHNKAEIAWLLRVPDTALRQRIAQIKKRWRDVDGRNVIGLPGLDGALAFGRIRQNLLKSVRHGDVVLASHDPDGHLFVISSQNGVWRQQGNVPTHTKE